MCTGDIFDIPNLRHIFFEWDDCFDVRTSQKLSIFLANVSSVDAIT